MNFKNKTLLITGGTGSFGNAVLRQFLKSDVKEIRIFSRDEKKQEELRMHYDNPKLKFYLGDVREYSSVNDAMKGVDFVFHAAALKQVPSCEFYPMEAIRTNIIGSENVINASINQNVTKAIFLSTDKAVYPINSMGMSKALMEKLVIAKSRILNSKDVILCATRYGNVMASRGSVIPLFIKQAKEGKPITITDPKMTRFLMSLSDSVNLVDYAFNNGNQGDIFVQKAPASTVLDLAKAIKELFASKSELILIGTRHGEKLYETLISREEMSKAEDLGLYFRIPADNRDLNYSQYEISGHNIEDDMQDYTSHNTNQLSVDEIKQLLLTLDMVKSEL